MESFSSAMKAGGPGMIPTLIVGILLVGVALVYAVRPGRRFVPLLVSLSVLTLVSGALGFVMGVIKSIEAVGETGADARLSLIGTGESLNNVALALALIMGAAIATSVGALRQGRSATT